MFAIYNELNPSSQKIVDLIKNSTKDSELENTISKIFNDMISNANTILDRLYSNITNEKDISKIDRELDQYENVTLDKSIKIRQKFQCAMDRLKGSYTLELESILKLEECVTESILAISKVKRDFNEYKKKLKDVPGRIDKFKKEAEKVKKIVLEEINKENIDLNSIKSKLDELNSKFTDLYTYLNYEMLGANDQEGYEQLKIPNNSLVGIETIVDHQIPIDTKNINECLNDVLQDETYKSIVNEYKIASESTTTPPSQEPNGLVEGELGDNLKSFAVDDTQKDTVSSVKSSM